MAGEGKCPGTLILPLKKGFTKSKGGERGKKKMGEFEDELASCMMNPKVFDCEEQEHLSGVMVFGSWNFVLLCLFKK